MASMTESRARKHRPTSQELSRWFDGAQAREAGALQQLLAYYQPVLLNMARAKLQGAIQAKVAASDVVQSTLWTVTQNFGAREFSCRQEFLAWLLNILKNELSDQQRHFQDTQKRDIFPGSPLDGPEASEWLNQLSVTLSETIDCTVEGTGNVREMLAALDSLPPHYQLVIRLRYFEGQTFNDIGEKFCRSADAVRRLHNRALHRLREILV